MSFLRKLASKLPSSWQQELKRLYYGHQIHRGTFETAEPEFLILDQLVSAGDWVIDVGANVGHYTRRLSDLVGPQGRVIAVEPVPDTFALLAANTLLFRYRNVTLLNVAASDRTNMVGMYVPDFEVGLKNYYAARLTTHDAAFQVLTVALDSLALIHNIRLIKIDAEGHDPMAIRGVQRLLSRDHPTLIIESSPPSVVERLVDLGYTREDIPGSPNTFFRWLSERDRRSL